MSRKKTQEEHLRQEVYGKITSPHNHAVVPKNSLLEAVKELIQPKDKRLTPLTGKEVYMDLEYMGIKIPDNVRKYLDSHY